MTQSAVPFSGKRKYLTYLVLLLSGLLLNVLFSRLAALTGIPLYLDAVGTIMAAVLGGYLPGMLVGYLTNLILGFSDPSAPFYGVLNVLIAALATFLARRGWFRRSFKPLLAVPLFALIGGGLGSLLTFALYGLSFGEGISAPLVHFLYDSGIRSVFFSQLLGDFLLDAADKLVVIVLVILGLKLIPDRLRRECRVRFWRQNPMSAEERAASRTFRVRGMSLRPKMLLLIMVAMIIVAIVTTGIGFAVYRWTLIETRLDMAESVSRVLISSMDPDRVDEYIALGEKAPGYLESEAAMAHVLESSEDIAYVYVYQIRPEGCCVVFDPDTPEEAGADPGEIIEFDEDFAPFLPDLLAGKPIDPVESNGSYGWLYSIYTPVKDSAGRTVCYACVDISMDKLSRDQFVFLAKVLSLFVSFIAILLAIFLLLADAGVIMPINAMSLASNRFAFDSEEERNDSLDQLRSLGIHTGDEIENLYNAIAKTTEDSVRYIAESQQKNETIARMQENLITVLADMVESRDDLTGNHIKNTSAYTRIIMEQLRAEGIYTDQLTDEFISDVVRSAPLHDIGKIRIPDHILNKPGKLTDEEFEEMKLHTIYGRDVIEKAKKASSDISYLDEAENMATYHHEKWNGRGYPSGLSGEEIPLSARIMAVADVFDALVSRRSYKEGFSIEKSLSIIREGVGEHFDPNVANAFLHAEDRVRAVLSEQKPEE